MKTRNQKSKERIRGAICYSCGEIYVSNMFSKENPLIICGECGAEYFLQFSRDHTKGYTSLNHYHTLLDLLPEHLIPSLPPELQPRTNPFD